MSTEKKRVKRFSEDDETNSARYLRSPKPPAQPDKRNPRFKFTCECGASQDTPFDSGHRHQKKG